MADTGGLMELGASYTQNSVVHGQQLPRLLVGGFYNLLPLQNNCFWITLMCWTLLEDAQIEWLQGI